jgi:predicted negative regulator of RcsB-dependent stress response
MLRNIVLTFGPFRLAFAPEIERVHGELLLRRDQRDEAERGFRRALEIARARGERALELRAATSLARLLAQSKRADEARPILAGVHGSCTEGRETADLRAAWALLEQLGGERTTGA